MAEIRQATIKVRDRQVTGGSIPGDALFGEPFVNLYNGVLRFSGVTGGDYEASAQSGIFEVGSTLYNSYVSNRFNINDNFIISGGTGLISTYGGVSGAGLGGKFLSGTTNGFVLGNISDIQGVTTRVQPGVNTYTGGTPDNPTVNVVDSPSFNQVTTSGSSTFAGANFTGAIQSGGTDLYSIFVTENTDDITRVQAGTNIVTGGTANNPIISVVDSPSFNNVSFSGVATGGDIVVDELSASTIYSGGTDLYDIFLTFGDVSGTSVSAGSNINVQQSGNDYHVSVVDSPSFNQITTSGTSTFAGANFTGAIQSGTTDLYDIFVTEDTNDITRVQAGTNIVTGGTANEPIISLVDSPSINGLTTSGASTFKGTVTVTGLTNTRVVFAGAGGLLSDDDGMTYNSGTDVLTVNGNLTTNGTQYSGGTIVDDGIFTIAAATQVEVDSNLLPSAHLTYTLGAVGKRWDEVFTRKVSIGTSTTVIEDNLFSSTTGDMLFDFSGNLSINNNVLPNSNLDYELGSTGSRWSTVFAQDLDLTGALTVTGISNSSLTAGRVVYVGTGGELIDETGFEYDQAVNLLKAGNIQIGNPGDTGTTATIYGDVLIIGDAISGFTSELYIEDNFIELNYNPTASTESTSLGAGWSIQDGSGTAGTDVIWDIRGAATGLNNRSFSTNLFDLRIRETGTASAPNGLRVIVETDIIDGGSY